MGPAQFLWGSTGRSSIGASTGAGRAETAGLSNLDEPGIPASPVVEGSQSERAARSPQVRSQPTNPVRQNATWHPEVNDDVAVIPAIFSPAV